MPSKQTSIQTRQVPAFKGTFITALMQPQAIGYLVVCFASIVIFYYKSHESWDDLARYEARTDQQFKELGDKMSSKADAGDVKDLNERVSRQWTSQKDLNDKTNERVEDVVGWMHEQIGYHQAMMDGHK